MKATTVPTEVKSVLSSRACNEIAKAFSNALDARDNNGSIVNTVCETARAHMHGKPFEKGDMQTIIDKIASDRDWSAESLPSRSSEVRVLLRAYAKLPEAIKTAQRNGTCNWHFAMKMARIIGKGKAPDAAVKEARSKSDTKEIPIEGRVASLLKKMWKEKRAKRAEIAKAWDLLGLKGDVA